MYWLEKGNDRAGLKHILKHHEDNFADRGVAKADIPKLLDKALKSKAIKRGVGKRAHMQTIKLPDLKLKCNI
ncbi:hypothetical protein RYX41_12480 [Lactiplantibacillus plantarum]|nr:hypothetical protein [Lactiplantibacillus plantarum]